jgi:hypothetical protein
MGEHEHVKELRQDEGISFGIQVSQLADEGRSQMGGIRGVLPVQEEKTLLKAGAEVKRKVMSFPSSILDEIDCHY